MQMRCADVLLTSDALVERDGKQFSFSLARSS